MLAVKFILMAFLATNTSADLPVNLVRQSTEADSNQGIDYVLGFIDPNFSPFISDPDSVLLISTQDPRGADVFIDIPLARSSFEPEFPMRFNISQFETRKVVFPPEIRVTTKRDRGIHVVSENHEAKLEIVGLNDEVGSADTFLALPCILPLVQREKYYITNYQYYIFSASQATFQSTFLIIPCTEGRDNNINSGIQFTIPGERAQSVQSLLQYETYLVRSDSDLTGTIITSPVPIAVFSGHQCGQIPEGTFACDHLIEQIPPDVVYGTRFFVLPFAVRESGDIIKIGSTIDDNLIFITCNRREANGSSRLIKVSQTINRGGVFQYRTRNRLDEPGLSSEDYRRDFCCIESSKPAIVMQYMLGHEEDNVAFNGVESIGDPAMTLVPPVEQYKNNYILETPDDYLELNEYFSFISWAIPKEFFSLNNNDEDNFLVKTMTFVPTDQASGGSSSYEPIFCSNGEICGYGGTGIVVPENSRISYKSIDLFAALYVSFYGVHREVSFANPAGMELEPIGLPLITTYDVVVTEGVDAYAMVKFNRTGGNIAIKSSIVAFTMELSAALLCRNEGRAVAGSDFMAVPETRIVFAENEFDAQIGSPLVIPILDDDVIEKSEGFEVNFFVDSLPNSAGYSFPSSTARVTILDNDGDAVVGFEHLSYTVCEEANASEVCIVLKNFSEIVIVLTIETSEVTADHFDFQPYVFPFVGAVNFLYGSGSNRTCFEIPIHQDDIFENMESFQVILGLGGGVAGVAIDQALTEVFILDDDKLIIGFMSTHYEASENDGSVTMEFGVLEGFIASQVEVLVELFFTNLSATGGSDYQEIPPQVFFFDSTTTTHTVMISIIDDDTSESTESFQAVLEFEREAILHVTLRPSEAEVVLLDDDISHIGFSPVIYTSLENEGPVNFNFEVLQGSIGFDLKVLFSTSNGSAFSESDYQDTSVEYVITAMGSVIAPVNLTNDLITEQTEIFFGNLNFRGEDTHSNIMLAPIQAEAVIIDNDDVTNKLKTMTSLVLPLGITFGLLGLIFLLISIAAVLTCVRCKSKQNKHQVENNKEIPSLTDTEKLRNLDYLEHNQIQSRGLYHFTVQSSYKLKLPHTLMIPSCRLKLDSVLGQGEFGIVYKGYIKKGYSDKINHTVAVKTLRGFVEKDTVHSLLKECKKMYMLDHPNILKLIGVCMDGGPAPYVVMPYMANGSVKDYLLKERSNVLLDTSNMDQDYVITIEKRLLDMCCQVAKGMEYLASKRVIHRDLAARNCMLDVTNVIKVADFGLAESLGSSKDYFRLDKNNTVRLPIKWLALESIQDGIFSEKSDVWSFGVTCWEIFNGGRTPYPGIHPADIPKLLGEGTRLEKPNNAAITDKMFYIMMKCWDSQPNFRPSFAELVNELSALLGDMAGYLNLEMLDVTSN